MLGRFAIFALLTAAIFTPSSVHAQRGGNSGIASQNGWLFSLTQGKEFAQDSGRPLMVVLRCDP